VFQVEATTAGAAMFIVTVQLLEPETATLRLYRSFHFCPADRVAVQPPPPPFPPPPPLPPPPPFQPPPPPLSPPPEPSLTVMLELTLLW
jgi:hypothetical protein